MPANVGVVTVQLEPAPALARHAVVDAEKCRIVADAEGEVTIAGTVGTWSDRSQIDGSLGQPRA